MPTFSVNEHCAGGTGSFFEDQMSRLGLKIEDYSSLAAQAQSIPRLSDRCAVFAKTDIIHRQQEAISTPDILLGLCYAMMRNFKATIVRNLPLHKPVAFTGGVTCNDGVIRAIREVFGLSEAELIVPKQARFTGAIGAASKADTTVRWHVFLDALRANHARGTQLDRLAETEHWCPFNICAQREIRRVPCGRDWIIFGNASENFNFYPWE